MSIAQAGILAIAIVCAVTLVAGALGLRLSRTTSDFYVAGRSVSAGWNASAIGGEYLSAASFLGIAGLVYALGADMLWFPVGYTVGYVVLLVLVAAPLRRSGAYTLPDFAEARLESRRSAALASLLVIGIGWLYLLPQFQGAGIALSTVTGAPPALGSLIVAVVVLANVTAGGMRSITLVQAIQYWLKLTAISIPAFVLLALWWQSGAAGPERGLSRRRRVGPGAQRLRRPRAPGLRDLLDDPGALLRHHGPAARPGPLLHQPRRPRRPPDHARSSSRCSASSTCSRRSTACSAGCTCRRCRRAAAPTR